jgi:hypothetical protein
MALLLTGRSRHAPGPPPARPRPASADAGGFPRRRGPGCAGERLARHGTPSRAHRIITGTVSSRGHLRARPGRGTASREPHSVQRQARQDQTADLPRARAHQAPPATWGEPSG